MTVKQNSLLQSVRRLMFNHHGLDGPGIESRWMRDFRHPASCAMRVPGLFPGVKAEVLR